MEGSVLSFLKTEWKVSDTGSAHWASSIIIYCLLCINNYVLFQFDVFVLANSERFIIWD